MNKSRRDSNGLNKRERAILNCIEIGIEENGYSPSIREICKKVHLSSTATVQGYIKSLEERGYIKKEKEKGRTLRLLRNSKGEDVTTDKNGVSNTKEFYTSKELVNVPLVGKITAGMPILDNVAIPVDFVGNSEAFMLRVSGESMIEAGILDGDYILVRRQNSAENGTIVVALIEDEATVKTFYKEKDHIRLQPQNSTMDPIIVPDCQILGIVIGVFRKL